MGSSINDLTQERKEERGTKNKDWLWFRRVGLDRGGEDIGLFVVVLALWLWLYGQYGSINSVIAKVDS